MLLKALSKKKIAFKYLYDEAGIIQTLRPLTCC